MSLSSGSMPALQLIHREVFWKHSSENVNDAVLEIGDALYYEIVGKYERVHETTNEYVSCYRMWKEMYNCKR